MGRFILYSFFSLTLIAKSFGQEDKALKNLISQARFMGMAFVNGDYKSFSVYTYPTVLKYMGGVSKMIESLHTIANEMKANGMYIVDITFDEPLKIVKWGKELQTTISQKTTIQQRNRKLVNRSILIAISIDNGINWTFIDTSNKDLQTLRKIFPNLNPSLNLLASQHIQ